MNKRKISKLGLQFDRSFSKGVMKQLLWLLLIMICVYLFLVLLSFISELYNPGDTESRGRWYDVLFLLVDPGSGTHAVKSPFALLIAILGLIVFSGMLISVISNMLNIRVDSYVNGYNDYDVNNHVVVLGYNNSLPSLLHCVHKKYPDSFILLLCSQPATQVRDWLHANVENEIGDKVIVYNGVYYSREDLQRLNLTSSVKEVYVIGEEGDNVDSFNIKSVSLMSELLKDATKSVDCHVQFNSVLSYYVIQTVEKKSVFGDYNDLTLNILPFNFQTIWSQKVLATIPNGYKSLDGSGILKDSKERAHLFIFGHNDMGETLAFNAAQVLHFPNFKVGDPSTYSRITIIDPDAMQKGKGMMGRYQSLFHISRWRSVSADDCLIPTNWVDPLSSKTSKFHYISDTSFADIEWEFIEGDVYNKNIIEYLNKSYSSGTEKYTIAFCHDDSTLNIQDMMSLSEEIRNGAVEVLVRQTNSPETLLALVHRPDFIGNVFPFGMMTECYSEDLVGDEFGKLINACFWECFGDDVKTEDKWRETRSIDQSSSIYCANMIFYKLRSIGLDTTKMLSKEEVDAAICNNLDSLMRLEHNRWVVEKLLLGFRPLYEGAECERWNQNNKEKNGENAKKNMKDSLMHGDIILFDSLSPKEQYKDKKVNDQMYVLYKMLLKQDL